MAQNASSGKLIDRRETGDTNTNGSAAVLAIGIVTYNNSQAQLKQLWHSIELAADNIKEHKVAVKIYVIDNGEKSVLPESDIEVIKLDPIGNVGFGGGMNALMSAVYSDQTSEWFLCLNPDGAFHYKSLNELLLHSAKFPDSLIEARQFPDEHPKLYDPITYETPWASGACLLIRRKIYEAIGGFDPNIFMYLEDIDYSWRAKAAGFSIKIAPHALFGHSVLNRPYDPNIERFYLLSGRYLGFKWKNARFVKWVEEELVRSGLVSSRSELPALPPPEPNFNVDNNVTDFEHGLAGADSRWSR